MSDFELVCEPRTETGSSAARRLRRQGRTPITVYGGGKDVSMLSADTNELKKQLSHEAFFSHILSVKVGKRSEQAVLKELQRVPYANKLLHLDLQRVVATEAIEMRVPLHFMNEETCVGRKAGGVISHALNDVLIRCLPRYLPEYIEVDIGHLGIGDTVHLSELKLPEGVELVADIEGEEQDQPVVTIYQPRELEVEEEAAEEELEEAVSEAGEGKPEEEEGEEPGEGEDKTE